MRRSIDDMIHVTCRDGLQSLSLSAASAPVLLKLPLGVVQGTDLPGLEPATDAVEVEGVVAHAPGHRALHARRARLVRLALDAEVHDVVPADGAVVDDYVPRPERDGVPLFDLEPLLLGRSGGSLLGLHRDARGLLSLGRVLHNDIRHLCLKSSLSSGARSRAAVLSLASPKVAEGRRRVASICERARLCFPHLLCVHTTA